jgi:hypothetical protein
MDQLSTYKDHISALFNNAPVKLVKRPVESYMSKTMDEGTYLLWIGQECAAGFSLVAMPGCCGIVISTGAYVYSQYRQRGLGTLLNNLRKQMAWDMGYSLLLCTDVITNIPQQKILSDWTPLGNFTNRRTGNVIAMHEWRLENTGVACGF